MLMHAAEKLNQFAVIVAEGPDAQTFLQGQLTNSLLSLDPSHHQRTGYCSAKGRLLAIAQAWRIAPEAYALLLPTEIAPAVCKRLSMFVLRAKARLSLVPADITGIWNDPDAPADGMLRQADDNTFWLGMPVCPQQGTRALQIRLQSASPTASEASAAQGPARQNPPGEESAAADARWRLADVRAGTPWIWAATQDLFVPQMVNLELLSGVDFKKGCYPGQEVVARSQYLGKLNRRMFGLSWPSGPESTPPGTPVFSPSDPEQPCGALVSVSDDTTNNMRVGLVSVSLDAWAEGTALSLCIGTAQGPSASSFPLPYPVPTSPQTPNRPRL
ncbi:MAG: YgfZ/GcvT domain-containing protein [Burkholderiaceae bacterium]